MKKQILAYLSILLFAASCRPKPIDIEMPEHESRYVVTSQMLPGGFLAIMLTKSFSALKGNPDSLQNDTAFINSILVDHALVTLSHNGRTDTLLKVTPGLYVCMQPLDSFGDTYSLYMKDSLTGTEYRAAAEMPEKVKFSEIHPIVEPNAAGDSLVYMQYTIKDDPNTTNYYMINLTLPPGKGGLSNLNITGLQQNNLDFLLLSDKQFTNGEYSVKQQLQVSHTDTIAFSLSNISAEYYQYLVTYQKSSKIINQLTGEPINMPSNVQNGYGFFSIHSPDIHVYDLSQF